MSRLLTTICDDRLDYSVQSVVSLWHALWSAAKTELQTGFDGTTRLVKFTSISTPLANELKKRDWLEKVPEKCEQLAAILLEQLQQHDSCEDLRRVPKEWFCLFKLVRLLLGHFAQLSDLHYWAARDLRNSTGMTLSAPAVAAIQSYTTSVRAWLAGLGETPQAHYGMFVIEAKPEHLAHTGGINPGLTPANYFDLIAAAGWIWPAGASGEVQAQPALFDGEKLVGCYFGLPTAIPGFDEIFAGAGLLIIDAPKMATSGATKDLSQPIGGRVIVITGPYGSGKSTLALQLAVEVARKGGASIIAAMEQSAEECLYSMASLGILTRSAFFEIVSEMKDAIPLFAQPYTGTGVLAFLPITHVPTPDFADFTQRLEKRFTWMESYPLRLIVVDPMNSVLERGAEQEAGRRSRLLSLFEQAKQRGINLCLTRERSGELDRDPPFEENIADTVLQSVTRSHGVSLQRAIQVRKSRLQREEPGLHDFNIRQGKGLQIFPSSASVAASATGKFRTVPEKHYESTGIDGIDRLLGKGGLVAGDIVALDGPPGSSRTLVGSHFLFVLSLYAQKEANTPQSLFITDSDYATVFSRLQVVESKRFDRKEYRKKRLEDILICPMAVGSIEPSQILQTIRDHFERAEAEKRRIDRVLMADVARWNKTHSVSNRDDTFGYALMALLRSYGATCVLLADYVNDDQRSVLRDVIVNGADCLLKFEQMEFRGQVRYFIRATKSRDMTHRRDFYEVLVARGEVDVKSTGVLLRRDERGKVHPVKIRLFLHADSPHHHEFNQKLIGAIKTSLTDATIDEQWSHYDPQMFRLSASSAVDEVQIMQLDEYQLPNVDDPELEKKFFVLRPDAVGGSDGRFGELVSRLAKRILTPDQGSYFAAPFYQNISVLARHNLRLETACRQIGGSTNEFDQLCGSEAWLYLQKAARAWEEQGKEYIFFSCPLAQEETVETYNCLFFEILLTFVQPTDNEACSLLGWLKRPEAKSAVNIFRDLCYRSHKHERNYFESLSGSREPSRRRLRVFTDPKDNSERGPVLWRHWYNTLSEMMWDLKPEERSNIKVTPLPDDRATAGEWYLAVPAYSAAPELAWKMIEMITSPDRELQRIYHGVGLPIRESYYRQPTPRQTENLVSPFFHLSRDLLRTLVDNAFQRSSLPCYQRMTETISAHLQRILEIPGPTDQVNEAFDHLIESIQYIRDSMVCPKCDRLKAAALANMAREEQEDVVPSALLSTGTRREPAPASKSVK